MRTTPSRFSAFVASINPDLEGRPTVLGATGAAPSPGGPSVLEQRYPAVVRTLTLLWGHPELNEYLNRVATGVDTRLADLEPAAMAELMLLAEVHRRICPQLPGRRVDDLYGTSQWSSPWRPARYRG